MIQILLVDDQADLLDIAKLFIEKAGEIKVDTAISGKEALEKLKMRRYDAIVSDYEMPSMNGIEFLKIIKKNGVEKPFIIFTGKSREDVVIEALNTGADFYLQKGSNPKVQFAELTNMINHAVLRKRSEEALLQSEANYRTLVENTPDSIYMVDHNGRYLFMNSHHRKRLEIKDKDCRELIYADLHSAEDTKSFLSIIKEVISSGKSEREEYEVDGRWFVRVFSPVNNNIVEKNIAVTITSTEITEIKFLRKMVYNIEKKFRLLIESTNDSIYSVNPAGKYLYMNSHHKKRLGITEGNYVGRHYAHYHDQEATNRFETGIQNVLESGEQCKEEYYEDLQFYIRTFNPVFDEKSNDINEILVISINRQGNEHKP